MDRMVRQRQLHRPIWHRFMSRHVWCEPHPARSTSQVVCSLQQMFTNNQILININNLFNIFIYLLDNKWAFLTQKPLQSINEFTIGGTLKKPDRLPPVGTNSHSHFGRPIGSHLTGSRFAFRKVLSLQCNWKYVAIAFMLVTMALFIAITYIMSTYYEIQYIYYYYWWW